MFRDSANQVIFSVTAVALLALAAALLGAVHPWSFWPLGLASVVWAVAVICCTRPRMSSSYVLIVALLTVPVFAQLVPLPVSALPGSTPAATAVRQTLTLGLDTGGLQRISVSPAFTATALGFLFVEILWAMAVSLAVGRLFTVDRFASALVFAGVALAVFALAQQATFNGKIYWFWESQGRQPSNYYGPFVNRNHFAGWMNLVMSLGSGLLMGRVASSSGIARRTWRDRWLWVGSPEASSTILTLSAVATMAVSLVWSLSRSGIAACAASVFVLTVAVLIRLRSGRRAVALVFVVLALVGAVSWRGVDSLASWYGNTHTLKWRFALWVDSIQPLKDFLPYGSGLNSYGQVMLIYPQTDTTVHAQQAHNDYLQLGIEGGLLVVGPWLMAAGMLGRLVARRLRETQHERIWWIRMGALAGISGLAVQELTEFSLQIPAVAILLATLVGIAVHDSPSVVGAKPSESARKRLASRPQIAFSRR